MAIVNIQRVVLSTLLALEEISFICRTGSTTAVACPWWMDPMLKPKVSLFVIGHVSLSPVLWNGHSCRLVC